MNAESSLPQTNTKATSNPHHSKRRLVGAGAVLAISQILGVIIQVLIFSTIQRKFTLAENGTFFWIQQICAFAFLIAEMGMNSVVMKMYVENQHSKAEQQRIITTFFLLRLALWLAATVIVLTYTALTESTIMSATALYCLYSGIAARGTMFRTVLETPRRAANMQVIPALGGLLDVVLIAAFLYLSPQNLSLNLVVTWFLISSLPGLGMIIIAERKNKLFVGGFKTEIAKKIVLESAPILASICLMQIYDKCDTFVLNQVFGREVLGGFGAVMRVITPTVGLLMIISAVLAPPITHLKTSNIERCKLFAVEGLKLTLLASSLCALIFGGLAQEILSLTAGSKYVIYADTFRIAAWILVPGMTVAYLLAILTALGLQQRAVRMTLVMCIAGVSCTLVFAPLYGILGAVIARILGATFAGIFGLFIIQQFLANLLLKQVLLRFVGFLLLIIVTLWAITTWSESWSSAWQLSPYTSAIMRLFMLGTVFISSAVITGLVQKSDLTLLGSLRKS